MPKYGHGLGGIVIAASLVLGCPAALRAQEPESTLPDSCDTAPEPEQPGVILPVSGQAIALAAEGQDSPEPEACEPADPVESPPPARPAAPDVFGSSAIAVGATVLDSRWNSVRTVSLAGLDGPWKDVFLRVREQPGADPVRLVNRWVNERVRFEDDRGSDEWADAVTTLMRGSGDCEDFAIAKMTLLRHLGIPAGDMFLLIVRDTLRHGDHAVLVVRRAGVMQILDNRTDMILTADQVTDYRPTLSYSGGFAWAYGYRIGAGSVGAGRRLPN